MTIWVVLFKPLEETQRCDEVAYKSYEKAEDRAKSLAKEKSNEYAVVIGSGRAIKYERTDIIRSEITV